MADVSGVDNLNSNSNGSTSLAGIKSAIDNLNSAKAESSAVVPNTRQVNGHALSADVTVSKSDVSLGNVDNTSDATKNSAAATLLNKVINAALNTLSNITEAMMSLSDVTTGNVSSSAHGFAPKNGGTTTKFLRDDGTYAVPTASPAWVDEGTLTFAGSSADQFFSIVNTGKSLYKVMFDFSSVSGGTGALNMQVNGITAADYDYVTLATGSFTSATGQSSILITNGTPWTGEITIRGVADATTTVRTYGALVMGNVANAKLLTAVSAPDSGNLTSIKILVNGATVTGKVHIYSLAL
jgi:hypothetical protein